MRFLLVILLSSWLAGCSSSSDGGNEGPGGGDVTAQKAAELAAEIYSAVRASPRTYPEVPLAGLQSAISRARIIIRDKIFLNGVEMDAMNDGVDLIGLNRHRWRLITEPDRKRAVLFHELLGLMGLEKNNYFISSRMLSAKNRFADKANYTCSDGLNTCAVVMKFDGTLNGFLVSQQTCGGFLQGGIVVYRRIADAVYSTNGYCPEPEAPTDGGNSKSCSIHSGSGLAWDTLNFMDGFEFFFTGLRNGQLHCRI